MQASVANQPAPKALDQASLDHMTRKLVSAHQQAVSLMVSEEQQVMAQEELGMVNAEWAELACHMEKLLQQNLVIN